MKPKASGLGWLLQVLVMMAAGAAYVADAGAQDKPARKDLVLRGDAKCTRCHDEGDDYPVLAIGQTRHGVKADGRTPTCTSCHGESDRHIGGAQGGGDRPKPDFIFRGKDKT